MDMSVDLVVSILQFTLADFMGDYCTDTGSSSRVFCTLKSKQEGCQTFEFQGHTVYFVDSPYPIMVGVF